jgi:spore germination protein KC
MKLIKALLFIVPLLITVPLLLCGCKNDMSRREIDEINFIHAMGIDFDGKLYTLSAIYSSDSGADPEKGEAGKEDIMEASGATPYEAFEELRLKSKKIVSVANTGYFLFGDGAARAGIRECLDFISHDETIKMESLIFVTKDMDAKDFLGRGIENEQTIQADLEAVEQKQLRLITRNDNTLINILNEMKQDYYSLLIPYLESEENAFLIRGYGVFDNLMLIDYLDMDISSGINFVRDIVRAYPIYLEDGISLSLTFSDVRLKSRLEDGQVKIRIEADFETMVKETNAGGNIYTSEKIKQLTAMQNDYIKDIIKKAAEYSAAKGLDIFRISRLVENEHEGEWEELKENWKESISEVEYEYDIRSKISKSFILY